MDIEKIKDKYEDFCLAFFMELRDKYGYKLSADQLLSFLKASDNIDITDEESVALNMQMFFCHQFSETAHFMEIFHKFYLSEAGMKAIASTGVKKRAGENKNVFLQKSKSSVIKNAKKKVSLPSFKCERFFSQFELVEGICDYSSYIHAGFLNLYEDYIRFIDDKSSDEKNLIADTVHNELKRFVSYCKRVLSDPFEFVNKSQEVSSYIQLLSQINDDDETNDSDDEDNETTRESTDYIPQSDNRIPVSSDFTKKDIRLLTKKDMEEIKRYIKENAHKLKGRVNQNLKKSGIAEFDYKKTVKDAFKTGMVPIYLSFKKPKPKKVKIICFLDISPSCITAASVLLHLLHALESSFRGGVEMFSFTDTVTKITSMIRSNTVAESITKITDSSKGQVSDYSMAFEHFNNEFSSELHQNTIFLILGDMRNNYRRFKKEGLSKISTRIHAKKGKVILLHTDPKRRWYKDDSILKSAEGFIDEIYEIKNVDDILSFLSHLELK